MIRLDEPIVVADTVTAALVDELVPHARVLPTWARVPVIIAARFTVTGRAMGGRTLGRPPCAPTPLDVCLDARLVAGVVLYGAS